MKRLIWCVENKKKFFVLLLAISFVIAAAFFDAEQPKFLSSAIDSIQNEKWWGDEGSGSWYWINTINGSTNLAFFPSIFMMLIYASASLVTGIFAAFFGTSFSLHNAMVIRNKMYNHICNFSFNEIDKFSTPSLVTRLSNDVQKYQSNLQLIITLAFRAPVTMVISAINAFTPPLGSTLYGFCCLGMVIAMLTIITLIAWKIIPLYVKAQLKLDGINSVMRENILGVRLVKIFGLQEKLFKKYSNENNAYRDLNIKSGVLMAPITSVVYLILNSGTAIILLIAGMLFVNSDNHPSISGGIFAFTQIITILLFASLILVAVIINHVRTVASIKRINEVFETNSSLIETKKPLPLNLKNNSVEFRNVSFKYYGNQKDAISNINFFIPTGKTLGIIGETGSGKTTIASLLSRFYDVNKGSVKIGGIDVRDLKLEQLRDKVCVVLQEPVLFSGTILSNLKYGNNNANNKKIKNAAMDACAWWDVIENTPKKLNNIVEQRGKNYSGGQKQRLSLARTLVRDPKILVLDDTTSALDLLTEKKVQDNLQKYKDVTKIIISQRISSIMKADMIIVLQNGKIIETGNHNELLKNKKIYRKIADLQLGDNITKK